jgi:hypothetical protein
LSQKVFLTRKKVILVRVCSLWRRVKTSESNLLRLTRWLQGPCVPGFYVNVCMINVYTMYACMVPVCYVCVMIHDNMCPPPCFASASAARHVLLQRTLVRALRILQHALPS